MTHARTNDTPILVGRQTSHFTRVAAIVADELGVVMDSRAVQDLASRAPSDYGGNPALKLPVLLTESGPVFGTENICRALVRRAPRDRRVVLPEEVEDVLAVSAQELVWHAMSAQVQWIMGTRLCGLDGDNLYFVKCRRGLEGALTWLEANLEPVLVALPAVRGVSVLEVSLYCLIEHLSFRPSVPLTPYPRLVDYARHFGARPSCQRTPYRTDVNPPQTPMEPPSC